MERSGAGPAAKRTVKTEKRKRAGRDRTCIAQPAHPLGNELARPGRSKPRFFYTRSQANDPKMKSNPLIRLTARTLNLPQLASAADARGSGQRDPGYALLFRGGENSSALWNRWRVPMSSSSVELTERTLQASPAMRIPSFAPRRSSPRVQEKRCRRVSSARRASLGVLVLLPYPSGGLPIVGI